MKKKSAVSILFLISVFFLLSPKLAFASSVESDNTIVKGVFIDEVDVGGMTKEQAQEAVDAHMNNLRGRSVVIMVGENSVVTTLGYLGFHYEPNDNIKQALALAKSGNLIKRYKDKKDIEQGNVVYPLTFTYDESKIRDIVSVEASAYNVEPVNATVSRKNNEFIYTDHIPGSKVNVEETVARVKNAIDNWDRQDIVVEAVVEEDLPIYTREVVEKCNTLLGQYTTEYADSAEGRAANLANGARLINNAVLYPGEIFSAYKYLTPFTEENGYYVAKAYLQGKVVDSIGGGACQVTTTLYNAVLYAELEVVERQPHSMTISYVDLSRDAAIAGTYKDFKFMNNTDVPILIEATTKGRRITFKIWGHETRDTKNRKVEFKTVVTSTTPPPADVVTEDPTQPKTYRKVTQSAHTGYKAELYKIVYENGVEVSRTLVNKSNYAAAPRYVTVGTKEVEEEDTGKEADKETKPKKEDKKDKTKNNTQKETPVDNNQDNSEKPNTETSSQTEYEFEEDESAWEYFDFEE